MQKDPDCSTCSKRLHGGSGGIVTSSCQLPVLEKHDSQAANKWKRFNHAWTSYSLATGLDGKDEKVQVTTLLTVIGEEAREVFAMFTWSTDDGNDSKICQVLSKFEEYCKPYHNITFK